MKLKQNNDTMTLIDLKIEKEEIYRLNDLIEGIIGRKDVKIELIVEEIFINILSYSSCDYIKADVNYENNSLIIEFIDNGKKFNPLSVENPEFPDNIETAKIGGLGLALTKTLADGVKYRYENGENHFTLIKEVDEQS